MALDQAERGATAAQQWFQLSINTEPSYDNVTVEARTVGQDNWTTLADRNGGTQTSPPAECEPRGFLLQMHPYATQMPPHRRVRRLVADVLSHVTPTRALLASGCGR